MVDPADDWELANLEQQVADLESEKSELHTLVLEARSIIDRALDLIDDNPLFSELMAEPWLRRTDHIR